MSYRKCDHITARAPNRSEGQYMGRIRPSRLFWLTASTGLAVFAVAMIHWLNGLHDRAKLERQDTALERLRPFGIICEYTDERLVLLTFDRWDMKNTFELPNGPFNQVAQAPRAGDAQIRELIKLPTLESLSLNGTTVSDEGLIELGAMPSLRHLAVCDTRITAEGLRHLSHLQNLRSLHVNHKVLTKSGLVHLQALRGLEVIRVCGRGVARDTLRRVANVLPKARIEVEERRGEVLAYVRD